MSKNSKIEKYIYKFLVYFDKKDFKYAKDKLMSKYNLDIDYFNYIVDECIKSEYVDGIICNKVLNNFRKIIARDNICVARKGYIFINDYKRKTLNLFLIPFKNLLIIVITAFITSLITLKIERIFNFIKNLLY